MTTRTIKHKTAFTAHSFADLLLLCEKVGVVFGTVKCYESGAAEIVERHLTIFTDVLDVSYEWTACGAPTDVVAQIIVNRENAKDVERIVSRHNIRTTQREWTVTV